MSFEVSLFLGGNGRCGLWLDMTTPQMQTEVPWWPSRMFNIQTQGTHRGQIVC